MKKKLMILVVLMCTLVLAGGCGKDKINTNSKIYQAKENMLKLDNFSYKVALTTTVVEQNMTINMDCKQDLKNKLDYCSLDALGVKNDMYTDYNNKVMYSKVSSGLLADEEINNKWTKTKMTAKSNSWNNIANYIFNESSTEENGYTVYRGTISTSKLTKALSQMNTSSLNFGSLINKDIPIEVKIDSNNYIKEINFEIEVVGVKETVKVEYSNYDTAGDITLPSDIE